ncbi:MAG: DUF47 family protein [Coriobacteriia bacterium]|nr:DUF47 family protein [Coriobacteriia bacterium]
MAKRFDYFEALENQADFAVKEAELLLEFVENFNFHDYPDWIAQMHTLENAADSQIHTIYTHLATEFITPIDREDILLTAQRLDDIVDSIEDILIQMHMYDVTALPEPAIKLVKLIMDATLALKRALEQFKSFKKSSNQVRSAIVEVNDVEEKADRLYFRTMHSLYREYKDDPLYVMIWSNLYAQMEAAVDNCEVVADNLDMIILKNS